MLEVAERRKREKLGVDVVIHCLCEMVKDIKDILFHFKIYSTSKKKEILLSLQVMNVEKN